jgi:hypothetical protein
VELIGYFAIRTASPPSMPKNLRRRPPSRPKIAAAPPAAGAKIDFLSTEKQHYQH